MNREKIVKKINRVKIIVVGIRGRAGVFSRRVRRRQFAARDKRRCDKLCRRRRIGIWGRERERRNAKYPPPHDESADPMAKYDPPIKITTVIELGDEMQQMLGVKSDVLTDNSWFNGYKSDLGIDVEIVWSIPGAQYDEKLNTQISANDLPDVFKTNAKQLKLLVDNGMVADMTQAFADYSTDFTKQMMVDDNNVAISQATFGGRLMALPYVGGNRDGVPLMWIRRDWLQKLGKSVPTTVSELEDVALAFVNDDPDGNGQADTYGIALHKALWGSGLCDVSFMFEMFDAHVASAWLDKGGRLENGIIQPETKTALATFADWYSKGIFDKEFIAKDSAKVAEDITAGKLGIAFGQHWNAFWPYPDSLAIDPNADWIPAEIPSATGSPAKVMVNGSAGRYYAVNVDCEHPEAAVKLYNYFYAKDCALSPDFDKRFHIPGSEQMEKPQEAYQWAIVSSTYPMQNLFIHRNVVKYNEGDKSVIENSWVADNALQGAEYMEDKVANSQYWATYIWSGAEGAFSVVDSYEKNGQMLQNGYILADTDAMTTYGTTLGELLLETVTKMINGQTPVSDFDAFVEQWKSLGGDEITA
jgi:putative aldouronate transport system substrate-binding protein